MKLKVCVEFCDRITDEVYHIGDIVEVTDKRGAEILANPLKLAEAVEAPKPQKSASKAAPRKKGVKKVDE
jgi:hypothetical protein